MIYKSVFKGCRNYNLLYSRNFYKKRTYGVKNLKIYLMLQFLVRALAFSEKIPYLVYKTL